MPTNPTTPDIDTLPEAELRTRLKVALEENNAVRERVIELEMDKRKLEDSMDGMDASQGLPGGALTTGHFSESALEATGAGAIGAAGAADSTDGFRQVAAFIGLDLRHGDNAVALMDGIRRLRDGGAAGEEGSGTDTLAESIEHNRTERIELGRALQQARQIINQVAAALNVGGWDKDGTEIIQRAQRIGVVNYTLRDRLRVIEDAQQATPHDRGDAAERVARRQAAGIERCIMAQVMGSDELAKFLKARPNVEVTPALFESATGAATGPGFLMSMNLNQIEWWVSAGDRTSPTLSRPSLHEEHALNYLLRALHRSAAAKNDLLQLMNGVVLPILRTQVAKGILSVADLTDLD